MKESHCLQNGSWTEVAITCVPIPELVYGTGADGFLVRQDGARGTFDSGTLTTVAIVAAVILGTGGAALAIALKTWYVKVEFENLGIGRQRRQKLVAEPEGVHQKGTMKSNMPGVKHWVLGSCRFR